MNYRHAFHAGNFADLLKHALLLAALDHLTAAGEPLAVLDTHAGAGLYDLGGAEAQRSGEAEAGIARLMAEDAQPPAALARLAGEVRALNGGGEVRLYPGSPLLTVRALRRGDRYSGCELRPDDHAALEQTLRRRTPPGVAGEGRLADGYEEAARRAPGRRLLVIDPPFERGDDYRRIVDALARRGGGPALVWLPLKDLDTFDRFLTDLEGRVTGEALVVEARLRPLDRPLKMNGCAVVLMGLTELLPGAREAAEWIVARLGDPGGEARAWRL